MIRVEHVMGMPIVVEVRDGDVPDEVFDWLRRVDETFSTYKDGSEICRLRRGELDEADASDDVRWVLRRCRELRDETDGLLRHRRRRARSLRLREGMGRRAGGRRSSTQAGSSEYAINAGGDIRTRGRWRIGIQHPLESQAVAKVVEADDLAIATSGAYERGEHVRDPHTGAAPVGDPLGDGHRARPRDRRRVRDRGVRDGRRGARSTGRRGCAATRR